MSRSKAGSIDQKLEQMRSASSDALFDVPVSTVRQPQFARFDDVTEARSGEHVSLRRSLHRDLDSLHWCLDSLNRFSATLRTHHRLSSSDTNRGVYPEVETAQWTSVRTTITPRIALLR